MAIIEVEVKSVYGNTLIYPANAAAEALARIAGKKTLSVADLKNAGALGLEVVEIHKNYKAIAEMAYNKGGWDNMPECAGRRVRLDGSLA